MISKLSIVSLAVVLGLVSYAPAAPLYNVTFDNAGDNVGNPPNDAPANEGGVTIYPSSVVAQSGTSILVQNGYTDTMTSAPFGTGQVAVFTDNSTGAYSAMVHQAAVSDEVSTGVYTVSMDWIEDKGIVGQSSFFIGTTNQSRGKNFSALFLDLGNDAGNIRSANSVTWGATLGTAARGVAHHLDWVIDLDQADFTIATQVYIDGVFVAYQQREPIGGAHDGAPAFGAMTLSSSGAATGVLAFDNITIQAGTHVIPEPTSALGAGAALIGLAMRRRQA